MSRISNEDKKKEIVKILAKWYEHKKFIKFSELRLEFITELNLMSRDTVKTWILWCTKMEYLKPTTQFSNIYEISEKVKEAIQKNDNDN